MRILKVIVVVMLAVLLISCVYVHSDHPGHRSWSAEKSPPDWAPAHGARAKHRYRYYPASYVYFDLDRELWFYLEGNSWRAAVRLPSSIVITSGDDPVMLDLDTDKPHRHFHDHKKKYPPGKHKKKHKEHKRKRYGDDDDDDDDRRGKRKKRDD